MRSQVTKGSDHNKTTAQGSRISLGPGSTEWTCPILNIAECLLITRENGGSQAWQGKLQITIWDLQHVKWAQTGTTGGEVSRRSMSIRKRQDYNKSHCKSLNTFQEYSANVPFLACWILKFSGEVTEDNQSRQALKSKLVSRQQETPVDQVRMQVWHGNIGTLIISYPRPAGHVIKWIFNQQAGVFCLAEDLNSFASHRAGWWPPPPEESRMPDDYFCGCVNNWGGPKEKCFLLVSMDRIRWVI